MFQQTYCFQTIAGLLILCMSPAAIAEQATYNATRSVTQPKIIERPAQNRFTSGVRAANSSSHVGPNFRAAKSSSHLGPNFRTTQRDKGRRRH